MAFVSHKKPKNPEYLAQMKAKQDALAVAAFSVSKEDAEKESPAFLYVVSAYNVYDRRVLGVFRTLKKAQEAVEEEEAQADYETLFVDRVPVDSIFKVESDRHEGEVCRYEETRVGVWKYRTEEEDK